MAKNILHHIHFDSEATLKRLRSNPQKQDNASPLPWITSFAGRLVQDRVGVAFASPFVQGRLCEDNALDEYNGKIIRLHNALPSAGIIHILEPWERLPANKMFQSPPSVSVYILEGKIEVAALLQRDGKPANGVRYPQEVSRGMWDFVNRLSSFIVVGTYPSVKIARDSLYSYLVHMGMHRQKKVETDSRFTYSR